MFIPGFMLAIACIYIVTLCTIHPESGPRNSARARRAAPS
jgi:hypothetical protein